MHLRPTLQLVVGFLLQNPASLGSGQHAIRSGLYCVSPFSVRVSPPLSLFVPTQPQGGLVGIHAGKGLEGKGKAPGAKGLAADPRGSKMSPSSCHAGFLDALVFLPIKRGQKSLYPPLRGLMKTMWPDLRYSPVLESCLGNGQKAQMNTAALYTSLTTEILNPSGFLASPGLRTLLLCQPR